MGWCTTLDLEEFLTEAGDYLRSRAAENTLLLSAVQAARTGRTAHGPADPLGLLFGWWQPPDGGGPRGAFVHEPTSPLLISGRVPEMATTLAATLAKMGRLVSGVDAPTEAADAFAATWSQRSGTSVRVQRRCRVYRIARPPRQGGGWLPSEFPGPSGRLGVAQPEDQALLADWLSACAAEATERLDSAFDVAADLISYGGAIFWEVPPPPGRRLSPGHYLADRSQLDGQFGEPAQQPVALVTLTRPIAGTVRISRVYTPPEHRNSGYSAAITMAASYAILAGALSSAPGRVDEVIMITDRNRPDRSGGRFGYQLVDERAVLRFGPVTGSMPQAPRTGPTPRLPTGPLPRLPRLRR
jgi:hypothetical protein